MLIYANDVLFSTNYDQHWLIWCLSESDGQQHCLNVGTQIKLMIELSIVYLKCFSIAQLS